MLNSRIAEVGDDEDEEDDDYVDATAQSDEDEDDEEEEDEESEKDEEASDDVSSSQEDDTAAIKRDLLAEKLRLLQLLEQILHQLPQNQNQKIAMTPKLKVYQEWMLLIFMVSKNLQLIEVQTALKDLLRIGVLSSVLKNH